MASSTEFDILKATHRCVFSIYKCFPTLITYRFLRDEQDATNLPWEEKLAHKYYSSLYREFAVCDLKHYKSGNVRSPHSRSITH